MKKTHGFTLLEILIALAILGVLAAIAIPNFMGHKQKAVLGAAKSFMMTVASKQQEYLLTNRQYAIDDNPGTTGLQKLNIVIANEQDINDNFTVTIVGPAPGDRSRFEMKLTPKSSGIMDNYTINGVTLTAANPLSINSADQKTPVEFW